MVELGCHRRDLAQTHAVTASAVLPRCSGHKLRAGTVPMPLGTLPSRYSTWRIAGAHYTFVGKNQ